MKVLVFGNSGSGKSTYARALAAREGLAHLDSDSIVWERGKIAVQRPDEAVAASLRNFIDSHAAWVIEGCYGELVRAASAHCTLLVFLNPGIDACLANNLKRPWEPHKYASLELQNTMLDQLQKWVADYYQRTDAWSYRVHREIFNAFSGSKVEHHDVGAYGLTTDSKRTSTWTLGGMSDLLTGKVQTGFGSASHWLKLFNASYSEKLGMPVFPGSLNMALDHVFDWFDARYEHHRIWFGREEYGGERDILLLPCELVSLDHRKAFLWTPTTAARDRRDPWVVEIVADIDLRNRFGLQDGDVVEVRVPTTGIQG